MLQREYKYSKPTEEKTTKYLGWLAQQLIKKNETEFLIEKMQPDCLENKDEKAYRFFLGFTACITFEIISRFIPFPYKYVSYFSPVLALNYVLQPLINSVVFGMINRQFFKIFKIKLFKNKSQPISFNITPLISGIILAGINTVLFIFTIKYHPLYKNVLFSGDQLHGSIFFSSLISFSILTALYYQLFRGNIQLPEKVGFSFIKAIKNSPKILTAILKIVIFNIVYLLLIFVIIFILLITETFSNAMITLMENENSTIIIEDFVKKNLLLILLPYWIPVIVSFIIFIKSIYVVVNESLYISEI
jgi:hypothetical protein